MRNGKCVKEGITMINLQEIVNGFFVLLMPLGIIQPSLQNLYETLADGQVSIIDTTNAPKQDLNPEESNFEISLAELGFSEKAVLNGPYQDIEIDFSLPPDWKLTGSAELDLKISSEFYTFLEAFTEGTSGTGSGGFGSILEISLNGQNIAKQTIEQAGDSSFIVELPVSAFSRSVDVQTLKIGWDSVLACQNSTASILAINPASILRFSYSETLFSPAIASYPAPFLIDNAIRQDPTAIIIPSDPSEQELSAMLSVSAGLGKLTKGKLKKEILSTDELSSQTLSASHTILIGKINSIESALVEPGMKKELDEILNSIDDSSGLVFMGVSPWNPGRAILIVTGRNDDAVLKASTALGTEELMPYSSGQYAVIKEVNSAEMDSQYFIDQTLIDLGSEDVIFFGGIGETTLNIPFIIPADISINPEAYMEMYFRHSLLLDYLRSTITISINNVLIGNIRMNDQSNENGIVRFILPPNVIKPLSNVITIKAELAAQDICGDTRGGDFWASVYGDSYLHLPPVLEGQNANRNYLLGDFPLPFIQDQHLIKSVFVLEKGDSYAWKKAFDIAYLFGTQVQSNWLMPTAKFTESFSSEDQAGNYLVIGLSSRIPFSSDINNMLPLPFLEDGRLEEIDLPGIGFELDQGQDLGYLEVFSSEEDESNVVAILGNSQTGLDTAVNLLISGMSAQKFGSTNIATITSDGLIHAFYIQPSQLTGNGQKQETGAEKPLFSSGNLPLYLLILLLVIAVGLIIWPVFSRKKAK